MPRLPEGLKNLLKLADFLDRLPPERFDYGTWGEKSPSCGTTACALGWASAIPEFKAKGLKAKWSPNLYSDFKSLDVYCYSKADKENIYAEEAAAVFFKIPFEDAEGLFIPDGGFEDGDPIDDPTYVAMKIRNYVEAVRP